MLSPIAAILVCIVGFVGYYNWRVTGSPVVFPHFIEQRMYFTTPVFLWQHETPPRTYANPQFDDFITILCQPHQTGWDSAVGQFWWKVTEFLAVFSGARSFVPVSSDTLVLGDRHVRLLLIQFALSRDRSVIVVFTMRTMLRPLQQLSMYCDAGNAPHAGLAVPRDANWHWIDAAGRAFSLLIGPAISFTRSCPNRIRFLDCFHRHYLLVLAITVFALVILRLGSLRIVLPTRRSWAISSCEIVLLFLSYCKHVRSKGISTPILPCRG